MWPKLRLAKTGMLVSFPRNLDTDRQNAANGADYDICFKNKERS